MHAGCENPRRKQIAIVAEHAFHAPPWVPLEVLLVKQPGSVELVSPITLVLFARDSRVGHHAAFEAGAAGDDRDIVMSSGEEEK